MSMSKHIADYLAGAGLAPNVAELCGKELARWSQPTKAAQDVLAERQRQVDAEGWDKAHDDQHDDGGLARAAACYAMHGGIAAAIDSGKTAQLAADAAHRFVPEHWPWASKWWKPKDRRSNLVRAGALILAEIERLDRANSAAGDGVGDKTNG